MTPKEKAEELLSKYYKLLPISASFEYTLKICKECSLIAVDELIKELPVLDYHPLGSYTNPKIQYWQNVKQEIQKL